MKRSAPVYRLDTPDDRAFVSYPRTMRALVIERRGTPVTPNIRLRDDWPDEPTPPPGHAVIRTLASAFNHMDLWVAMGVPGLDLTYPRVSGCDACGEIIAVADDVDPAWLHRRVIVNAAVRQSDPLRPDDPPATTLAPSYHLIGEHTHGMHREQFTAPIANCAPVDDADPVHAAAFALTTLTAYAMICTKGNLRPGQTALITGIGGGVATSALAICNWLGCPVCVTSRHQWKLDRARELGADCTILDEGQDWSRQVRQWTAKRGVDMAIDSIGKAVHTSCIRSLARGGTLVTPGCTTGPDATTDLARIFWNQLRVLGSTMGSNDELREITALFRAGHLAPVIDSVHKPEQFTDAYTRLESQEQFGKIVIDWR